MKKTTIEFYKVYHVNSRSNAPSMQDCMNSLTGKTHIYNNGDFPRDLYNLLELSHGCIGGVLRKVRPDNTIEYGQVGNDSKPLELEDDEGIFETNHFVYFPEYDIIGYIKNNHANHYSHLRACLTHILGRRIGMVQMLQRSSIEALLFNKNVVEITCSLPVSPLIAYDNDMWSNQALSALSQSGADKVDLTIKIDRRKKQGWITNSLANISNIIGLGATKLQAKTEDLDGNEMSPIDFLANKIVYIDKSFSYTKSKLDSHILYEKIINAYLEKLDEIEEAQRAYQMATY